MNVADKAAKSLNGRLYHYIDQAYYELVKMYIKSNANTSLIRASEIEAMCYKLAYKNECGDNE